MEIHAKNFDEEKDYLLDIFHSDSKNYHAWSYRLWFIERFNLWEGELAFLEEELDDGEVTNNSLWSYRYFLLMKTSIFTQNLVNFELNYGMNMLNKHGLLNEAAWVYVKGFLAVSIDEQNKSKFSNVKKWHILDFPLLKSRCIEV